MNNKYVGRHSKEYFKLIEEKEITDIKSNKFISKSATILGITAIVGTPLINSTQVLAAEFDSSTQTTFQTNTASDGKNQAKQQIDQAQTTLDEANKVAEEAKEQLNQTQQEMNNAQKNKDEAQAALDKKNAEQSMLEQQQSELNEKSVEEREQEINQQQQVIETDQQAIDDADNAKTQAEQNQVQVQQATEETQANQNIQETVVRDKSKEVDAAQKKYDSIDEDSLQKAVEEAQKQVDSDQSDVADKTITKDKIQKDLSEATQIAQDATDKVVKTQAELDGAKGTVTENEAKQAVIQAQIDELEAQIKAATVKAANLIEIPNGLTAEMYANMQHTILDQLSKDAYANNKYKYNAADAKHQIDMKNLTNEENKALMDYTFDLINNIRQQMGLPLVKQTIGSMDFAKFVGDNHSGGFKHDTITLNNAIKEYGVRWSTESLFGGHQDKANMNQVKNHIYNMVMMSMFKDKDQGYGHTNTIINFRNPDELMQIGVAYDSDNQMHIISFEDSNAATGNSKYDNTETDYVFTSKADLEQQITDMQRQLTQLQNDLTTAEQIYNDAVQTVTEKEIILEEAKTELVEKNNLKDEASTRLTKAEEDLKIATEQLITSQNILTTAKTDLGDIEQTKEKYKTELEQKNIDFENELNKLKNLSAITNSKKEELAQANQMVNEKSKELETAVAKLGVDTTKKTQMENELKQLKDIEQKLETIKNEIISAQNVLDVANEELETVKIQYGEKSDQYALALNNVAEAEKSLQSAKDKLNQMVEREEMEKTITEAEKKAKEKDFTETVVTAESKKNNKSLIFTNTVTSKAAEINENNANNAIRKMSAQSSLPQTGTLNQSLFSLMGIGLVALTALLRKKQKN